MNKQDIEKTILKKLFEVKKAGIKLIRDTKAYNYNYATLNQIQDKLGDILEKNNLIVHHQILGDRVRTQISDIDSGGFISSEIVMSEGIKPQDKGSEITYYRRYNLLCLLDLEVEDDDGKKANESVNLQEEDNKDWFGDDNFEQFQNIKDTFNNGDEAVKAARKKYKVSKAFAQKIKDLY